MRNKIAITGAIISFLFILGQVTGCLINQTTKAEAMLDKQEAPRLTLPQIKARELPDHPVFRIIDTEIVPYYTDNGDFLSMT